LSFLNRIFDRKTCDKIIEGYRAEQIQEMLKSTENVESFEYYYYQTGIKYPIESEKTTNRPREEVLSFLDLHFTESLSLHTEIQQKTYKSGRGQIVLKGRDRRNEIIKLGVINYRRTPN
jgi:hypothetical protein